MRGIGKKFAANLITGSITVRLVAGHGRSGFGVQLSRSYDFGAGNGSFRFGRRPFPPSITRKTSNEAVGREPLPKAPTAPTMTITAIGAGTATTMIDAANS